MTITSAGNPTKQETFVASCTSSQRAIISRPADHRHEVPGPMGLLALVC
jgi:hypothetical protein